MELLLTHIYRTIFSSRVSALPLYGLQDLFMGHEQILLWEPHMSTSTCVGSKYMQPVLAPTMKRTCTYPICKRKGLTTLCTPTLAMIQHVGKLKDLI